MTVLRILQAKGRDVVTVAPHRTLAEAAALLAQRRIGTVVVAGADGALAGILSERDIVRALAQDGADALDHPVSRHMTAKVVTCRESATVDEVMHVMTNGKFRHVPVMEGGRLVGIVSIGDVVKRKIAEVEAETRAMRDYIITA